MLRWSGHENGNDVDLDALGQNHSGSVSPLDVALHEFASAAAIGEVDALTTAREHLLALAGADVLVDSAAIVANFEMMTRLADGTGCRMPAGGVEANVAVVAAFGFGDVVSKR